MNTYFNDAHLDTLVKLKEIAEKHNCKIRFGTDSNSYDSEVEDIKGFMSDINEEVLEFLVENQFELFKETLQKEDSSIWFELYEITEDWGKCHTLTYNNNSLSLLLNDYWREELEDMLSELEEYEDDENIEIDSERLDLIRNAIDFIEENEYDNTGVLNFSSSPTIILGFGNEGVVIDHRVYRVGMALKFFSDLVCDYLGEPRIVNTY